MLRAPAYSAGAGGRIVVSLLTYCAREPMSRQVTDCSSKRSRLMTPTLAAVNVWTPACARVAGGEHARQDARLAKVRVLAELLRRKGWRRDTSYWPDRWLPHRPSTGQCAVTALIVQDQFGGQIVEAETNQGEAHFLNRLPGLGDIDITVDQFDPSVEVHVCGIADRKAILSVPDTVRRYKLLKNAVLEHTCL